MRRSSLAAVAAALLGAWSVAAQAQPAGGAPPAPAAPRLLSATFAVTDMDRAVAFYTKGLGLTATRRIDNARNSEFPLLFPGGGASLLLIQWKAETGAAAKPRMGRVIVDVPDLKALEARLTAAGYALRAPVAQQAQHQVLVGLVEDPDGNELELVQRGPATR